MIQANDLRIGNLIQLIYESNRPALEERIVRVDRIDEIGVEILGNGERVFGASYELLEGIPLTEEILLKCGARRIDKYTFVLNGLFIHMRKIGFVFNVGKKKIVIEHLHQLQNWAHALTNTELNIKL